MPWYNAGSGAGVWANAKINPSLKNILSQLCVAVNEREAILSANGLLTITSLTRSGSTATATVSSTSTLTTGDIVKIAGADQSEYNGEFVVTVSSGTQFTYTVSGSPATPATAHTKTVSSLTKGAGLATAICTAHGFYEGETITIAGATPAEFNGSKTVIFVDANEFHYTISAGTDTATGTITAKLNSAVITATRLTSFHYNDTSAKKGKPTATDFEGCPISKVTIPSRTIQTAIAVSSITRSGSTATVTTSGSHGLGSGQAYVTGADQSEYNGLHTITVTGSTTFTYTVSGSPASPATGTITCGSTKITRSGTTVTVDFPGYGYGGGSIVTLSGASPSQYSGSFAVSSAESAQNVTSITSFSGSATVTLTAHGYRVGDYVLISGAGQAEYNGVQKVTSVTANTFNFAVNGSPASPATGTITATGRNKFQFTLDSADQDWATGTVLMKGNVLPCAKVSHFNNTVTVDLPQHGLVTNDIVEVNANLSTDLAYYGPITRIDDNQFRYTKTLSNQFSQTLLHFATHNLGIKRTLYQLQTAIEGMLGKTLAFVTNSSPYETAYTLSSLLSAGSYGSSWISLLGLPRTDIDRVVLQMREALDLLILVKGALSKVTDSRSQRTSTIYEAGEASLPAPNAQEGSWDEAVAASASVGSSFLVAVQQSVSWYIPTGSYAAVTKIWDSTFWFSIPQFSGVFTYGQLNWQNANGWPTNTFRNLTFNSVTVTDADSDTYTLDASLNTTADGTPKSKPSGFFADRVKSLLFSAPVPASHPFASVTHPDFNQMERRMLIASPAGHLTKNISTLMTYG